MLLGKPEADLEEAVRGHALGADVTADHPRSGVLVGVLRRRDDGERRRKVRRRHVELDLAVAGAKRRAHPAQVALGAQREHRRHVDERRHRREVGKLRAQRERHLRHDLAEEPSEILHGVHDHRRARQSLEPRGRDALGHGARDALNGVDVPRRRALEPEALRAAVATSVALALEDHLRAHPRGPGELELHLRNERVVDEAQLHQRRLDEHAATAQQREQLGGVLASKLHRGLTPAARVARQHAEDRAVRAHRRTERLEGGVGGHRRARLGVERRHRDGHGPELQPVLELRRTPRVRRGQPHLPVHAVLAGDDGAGLRRHRRHRRGKHAAGSPAVEHHHLAGVIVAAVPSTRLGLAPVELLAGVLGLRGLRGLLHRSLAHRLHAVAQRDEQRRHVLAVTLRSAPRGARAGRREGAELGHVDAHDVGLRRPSVHAPRGAPAVDAGLEHVAAARVPTALLVGVHADGAREHPLAHARDGERRRRLRERRQIRGLVASRDLRERVVAVAIAVVRTLVGAPFERLVLVVGGLVDAIHPRINWTEIRHRHRSRAGFRVAASGGPAHCCAVPLPHGGNDALDGVDRRPSRATDALRRATPAVRASSPRCPVVHSTARRRKSPGRAHTPSGRGAAPTTKIPTGDATSTERLPGNTKSRANCSRTRTDSTTAPPAPCSGKRPLRCPSLAE